MPNLRKNWAFNWIDQFNSETVELYRETITYNSDGSDDITLSKINNITISMQPISETDLVTLPEGDRERVAFKIYTNYTSLQTNDIIRRLGVDYKIKYPPMPWYIDGTLHHYKTFVYNIEND